MAYIIMMNFLFTRESLKKVSYGVGDLR